MNVFRNLMLIVFATLVSLFASCQVVSNSEPGSSFATRNLTMKNGLPSNAVRAVFKDSRGLMWIGTDAGVCSYNGREFTIYSTANGLAGDNVWSITEDEKGFLWFGCHGGGLSRFDGNSFTSYKSSNGLIDNWVRVVFYSKRFHCLMVGTEKGVSVIKDNIIVKPVKPWPLEKESMVITSFLEAKDYIYITCYGSSVMKYYPGSASYLQVDKKDAFFTNSSCASLATSIKDTVFGNHRNGIVLKRGKEILYDTLDFAQVFGMAEDNNKNIWIAAWSYFIIEPGGIFRYDGKNFANFSKALGINDQEVWTVYFDKEQELLWVATLNEGLFVALPQEIRSWDKKDFGLENLAVNNVFRDKSDNIWLGLTDNLICIKSGQKLHQLDTTIYYSKLYAKIKEDTRNVNRPFTDRIKEFVRRSSPEFDHIFSDNKNNLWVGYKFGSFLYDYQSGNIKFNNTIADASVCLGPGDTLYCGNWNGFAVYCDIYKNLMSIDLGKFAHGRYPKGNIGKIIRHGNEIWMASWTDGIFKARGLNFTRLTCINGNIYFNIKDICFDSNNHLIAGDNKGIISIYQVNGDKLKLLYTVSDKNGLWGNSINWLLYDGKKYLWVGTNIGLNCIDLTTLLKKGEYAIRFYNAIEGYTVFSSRSAVLDSYGNIWAGGEEGLVQILPAGISRNLPARNAIKLQELEINGRPYHELGMDPGIFNDLPTGEFELNSSDNHLNFSFDIFNYRNPDKDLFRHKLEGFDEEWSSWSDHHNVYYTNLSPGLYILKVESYNYNTGIAAIPFKLSFRIIAPWWQQWYFLLIIVLGILIPSFFIIKFRVKHIRQNEIEKAGINSRIADLELNALQAQMNPHFIFNSINAIQAYVLDNKVDEALTFLSDFARVVRTSLENVSRKTITLEEALEFLKSYLNLEQMRFPGKIKWKFELDEDVSPGSLLIPPMIMQPYVENAIKHGIRHKKDGGTITLKVEILSDERLHMCLVDNGIGRLKSSVINFRFNLNDERNEHSTRITEKRLQLLNSPGDPRTYFVSITDLYDERGKPAGTRVDVYLPLVKQ